MTVTFGLRMVGKVVEAGMMEPKKGCHLGSDHGDYMQVAS